MKKEILTLSTNRKIAKDVFEATFTGDLSAIERPGQFVNLTISGCYLRRPLSVCDAEGDVLTLVYKVVGKGTEILSRAEKGEKFDTLIGLGNGFDVNKSGEYPLLIGGGVGVPPLYLLCRRLTEKGCKPTVILGFNQKEEVFYEEKFRALGAKTIVTTADGSYGVKGYATDAMQSLSYTFFYTCGPMPMFRAVEKVAVGSGEYSFEERMGCGFGACMGCSCKTKYGSKRICKDGPVLEREEIVW